MSDSLGTWIDGAEECELRCDDRGLHYGDGIFETLLVRDGRVRFLELHLARLMRGCARLRIAFTALEALRDDIARARSEAPPLAVLKILITRGSARRRGYAIDGREIPRRVVSLFASEPFVAGEDTSLVVATLRYAESPALAGLKHLNRLPHVLAASEARDAGAFDALLLDESGNVVSGAMSNVFAVRGDEVLTPGAERCGVEGVMRQVVLRESAHLGLSPRQQCLTLEDLLRADELFVTNARVGVVPVRRLGEHGFRMPVVARRIAAHVDTLDA